MIITRTPFRISFFGGGTDFPAWYRNNNGAVLSTTIDKYCYISLRRLPPFFEHKYRIVYSINEHVSEIGEIVHPAARETLRFMDIQEGIEMHHDGDLPARAGLGSSSAFTVGLLHALYAYKGKMIPKKRLAMEAIHIEQDLIKENVGSQDQVAVVFGGLNKITFAGDHNIEINPITISGKRLREFEDHLMLFFTGFSRYATKIEEEKIKHIAKQGPALERMHSMVDEAVEILNCDKDLNNFGMLLDEGWQLKKSLSKKVSTNYIDHVYEIALKNGATGGKILGAGGGGFILFFVSPEERDKLQEALGFLLHVPFHFDSLGSQIIYYSESGV